MVDERNEELGVIVSRVSTVLAAAGADRRLIPDAVELAPGRIDVSVAARGEDGRKAPGASTVLLRVYPNQSVELMGHTRAGRGYDPMTNAEASAALDLDPTMWSQVRDEMQGAAREVVSSSVSAADAAAERAVEATVELSRRLRDAVERGQTRAVARLRELGVDVDAAAAFPSMAQVTDGVRGILNREGLAATARVRDQYRDPFGADPDRAVAAAEDLAAHPWHDGPVRAAAVRDVSADCEFLGAPSLERIARDVRRDHESSGVDVAALVGAEAVQNVTAAVAFANDRDAVAEASVEEKLPGVRSGLMSRVHASQSRPATSLGPHMATSPGPNPLERRPRTTSKPAADRGSER